MKRIILLVGICLFNFLEVHSQHNVRIDGYEMKRSSDFFETLHRKRESLQSIPRSMYCYVILQINNKEVSEIKIIESPNSLLPDSVKSYLTNLFSESNGKWNAKGDTAKLNFSVTLLKKNQAPQDRIQDFEKHLEFLLSYLPRQDGINRTDLAKEENIDLMFE